MLIYTQIYAYLGAIGLAFGPILHQLGMGAFSYSFVVFAGRVVSSTPLLWHRANTVLIWRERRLRQLHMEHLGT